MKFVGAEGRDSAPAAFRNNVPTRHRGPDAKSVPSKDGRRP